jgi:hypothetical protein
MTNLTIEEGLRLNHLVKLELRYMSTEEFDEMVSLSKRSSQEARNNSRKEPRCNNDQT